MSKNEIEKQKIEKYKNREKKERKKIRNYILKCKEKSNSYIKLPKNEIKFVVSSLFFIYAIFKIKF